MKKREFNYDIMEEIKERWSPRAFDKQKIEQADIMAILEAARYAHFLKKDGILILNDIRIDPMPVIIGAADYPEEIIDTLEDKYNVIKVDALSEAKELGNSRTFNIIILGIAARYMDFEKEEWLKVIEETVPKGTAEINKKAFELGYTLDAWINRLVQVM